jgi:hypothetical protein
VDSIQFDDLRSEATRASWATTAGTSVGGVGMNSSGNLDNIASPGHGSPGGESPGARGESPGNDDRNHNEATNDGRNAGPNSSNNPNNNPNSGNATSGATSGATSSNNRNGAGNNAAQKEGLPSPFPYGCTCSSCYNDWWGPAITVF